MQRIAVPVHAQSVDATMAVGALTKYENQSVTARELGSKEKTAESVRTAVLEILNLFRYKNGTTKCQLNFKINL